MRLAIDEYVGQVDIMAGERFAGDRTFGLGEQHVELAFEVFEVGHLRGFVVFEQCAHALGELGQDGKGVERGGFVHRRMGYWHGAALCNVVGCSPNIVAEDHCPVFSSVAP